LVEKLTSKLEEIETVLRENGNWRMYGSSLLLVYDGAEEEPDILVKMIDFAHVFEIKDGGIDDGYLHGVNFLKSCLGVILTSNKEEVRKQIGGAHGNIIVKNGELLKKEDKADKFDQEVDFYKKAWNRHDRDSLSKVMPELIRVNQEASPRELVISDAVKLVKKRNSTETVSIMDIKLGERSFGTVAPNTPETAYYEKYSQFHKQLSSGRTEKIWEEISDGPDGPKCLSEGKLGKKDYLSFRDGSTTSRELGMRLTALAHKDYKVSQDESRIIETKEKFVLTLSRFFSSHNTVDKSIIAAYITQLEAIVNAINSSKLYPKYDMVGTSLLFLHCNGRVAVRWIDFANCHLCDDVDDNGILNGIEKLIVTLKDLMTSN